MSAQMYILDDDTKMFLAECGLSSYEEIFIDSKLDMSVIVLLEKADIQQLIKPLGDQIRFMSALKLYVRKHETIESPFYVKSIASADTVELNLTGGFAVDVSDSSDVVDILEDQLINPKVSTSSSTAAFLPEKITSRTYVQHFLDQISNESILEALRSTLKGTLILSNQAIADTPLCNADQSYVSNLLVDYAFRNFSADLLCKKSPFVFEALAEKITHVFTNEIKGSYFIAPTFDESHRQVNRYRGKLMERFYNVRGKKNIMLSGNATADITKRRRDSATMPPKKKIALQLHLDENDDKDEYNECKLVLQNLSNDWEMIEVHWKKSSTRRLRQVYSLEVDETDGKNAAVCTVNEITSEWPVIKHPSGYKLLEYDFYNLYKAFDVHKLSERWLLYRKGLLDVMLREIRDKTILKFLMLPDQVSDAFLLSCIPYLFTPHNIKKGWRPSILECQQGFFSLLKNSTDVPLRIENRRARFLSHGQRMQPHVIGIGSDFNALTKYYIVIDDFCYVIDTEDPIIAIDYCMKCIHSLAATYDVEAISSWMFLQKFYYNLNLSYDKVDSRVEHLLNQMKLAVT